MKLNFITVSTHLTGGNRVIAELANGLASRGHDITLVTLGKKEALRWTRLNARIIEAGRSFPQRIAGFLYRMAFGFQPFPEEETRQIMAALPEADATIATLSYTGFAAHRNAERSLPLQLHMHYDPLVREPGYKQKVMEEAFFLPIGKIVNSSWLAKTLKEKTGQEAIGIVFPALNHAVFTPRENRKPPEKGRPVRVVSLAKDKWWKGFPDALKAIALARQAGYNIEFLAFGSVFDKMRLPESVRDIPFTFVGAKKDEALAQFYRDADMLISASHFESFPLPPLEAMACGTPVITTPYGTEDYARDGETALIVPSKNPQAMADAIVRLINSPDLYLSLSRVGMQETQKFDWDASVGQFEAIILAELRKHST